jgi:Cysteine rich repeat
MKSVLMIVAVFLLSGSSAIAQDAAKACASDVKELCKGVEPGQGRIADCIKERIKDVSGPCQDVLATTAAGAKACADDVKQNCAEAKRRLQRRACIRSTSLDKLSEACRSVLARVAAAKK